MSSAGAMSDLMKITLLGTGDTIGTPRIGCSCDNCTAGRERLRTSLLVEVADHHILIDTSPDLRRQLLLQGSPHIDAVVWTHGHYDHYAGYGEFYRIQRAPPAYGAPPVLDYLTNQLHFLRVPAHPQEVYRPFDLFGITVTLVVVDHPPIYTCGVVLEYEGVKVVHTADTSCNIPARSLEFMKDADLLFVDSIVMPGINISKHMNYEEACNLADKLNAKDFRCVHMSHRVPWDLPHAGYDGEVFEF